MTASTFAVVGIDPAIADQLRARGGIAYVAESRPGYPCRQCLRAAEIGEVVILVSHDRLPLLPHIDAPARSSSTASRALRMEKAIFPNS